MQLDNRNSFVSASRARISGVKFGLDYNTKFKLGMGIHFLRDSILKDQFVGNDTITSNLNMTYINTYAEYVYYRSRKWEFSMPIHIGIGNTRYEYKYNDEKVEVNKKVVIIYEATLNGHYKIFKWVGISGGIGYRIMLKNNSAIEENFNSPIYHLGVKIFLGDIYRSIFH